MRIPSTSPSDQATIKYDGKLFIDIDGPKGKKRAKQYKVKNKFKKETFKVTYDDGLEAKTSR